MVAERPDVSVLEAVLNERAVDHRTVSGSDAASEICAESRLGYGVIAVGVATGHEGQLYSPMVDELLLNATIPVVIVRRARGLERPLPAAFSRVVVPVTGTRSSRAAQEVAFSISVQIGTEVLLTHVLNRQAFLPRIVKTPLCGNRPERSDRQRTYGHCHASEPSNLESGLER